MQLRNVLELPLEAAVGQDGPWEEQQLRPMRGGPLNNFLQGFLQRNMPKLRVRDQAGEGVQVMRDPILLGVQATQHLQGNEVLQKAQDRRGIQR